MISPVGFDVTFGIKDATYEIEGASLVVVLLSGQPHCRIGPAGRLSRGYHLESSAAVVDFGRETFDISPMNDLVIIAVNDPEKNFIGC
jgi:hypothetical protein